MSDKSNFQLPRNIFWPTMLIGVGFLILFSNLGMIDPVNLILVLRMWPLLLVGLGLNLLFGRDKPMLSNILSITLVVVAISLMIFAQDLGLAAANVDFITEKFSEPLGDAKSANLDLNADLGSLTIVSLVDSDDLIQGKSNHNLDMTFEASGNQEKNIFFDLDKDDFGFDFGFFDLEQPNTHIALSPDIPLDLNIDLGSGSSDLNLSGLELTQLDADTGSGRIVVALPAGDYSAEIGAGSGRLDITTADNATLNLESAVGSGRVLIYVGDNTDGNISVSAGSGTITIEVPEGVGVQITGTAGSGSVRTPNGYTHTGGNEYIPTSGTWTSPNYDDAEYQINIHFTIGSGVFTINEK